MKKTVLYIVLLGILGAGVWYFLFSNDKISFGVDESDFTVKDTASIAKIFMADKSGNTILLEKTEGKWLVNKQYPAMPTPVKNLLITLSKQTAMNPVSQREHNIVVSTLATKAVKVEVYNAKGKAMRIFYVGGQAGTTNGSYMLVDKGEHPYVVQIPGFPGYLTPYYSTDISDWRDRTIFDIVPDKLKRVEVSYTEANMNLNSFVFNKEGDKISIEADPGITSTLSLNERRAKVFATFFQGVHAEGYTNGLMDVDSILGIMPKFSSITVTTTENKQQQIDIYWMPMNKRSKNMLSPDPETPSAYDADRMYAVGNNYKDTMIIQRIVFDKIFRKAYEFYQPDEQSGNVGQEHVGHKH